MVGIARLRGGLARAYNAISSGTIVTAYIANTASGARLARLWNPICPTAIRATSATEAMRSLIECVQQTKLPKKSFHGVAIS